MFLMDVASIKFTFVFRDPTAHMLPTHTKERTLFLHQDDISERKEFNRKKFSRNATAAS